MTSGDILPVSLCTFRKVGNLQTIDKHILELKEQRNSFLPIAKLPTEIITRVFFLLARSEHTRRAKREEWDWLALTRVCRAWRELALGCPTLWAKIRQSFNMKKVEVFLKKSGQADLDIALGSYGEDGRIHPGILALIIQSKSRIRELCLATNKEIAEWDVIQNLIRDPMLRLKGLHLTADKQVANVGHASTVQLNILVNFVPAIPLERISLRGVMVPWNSPVLHGLSELSLGNLKASHRPTIGELLEVLEASPNLHFLKLSSVGPRLQGKCSKIVHLSRLKELHIRKIEYRAFVELFKSLVIPKDVRWDIKDVLNPFTRSTGFPDNLLNCSAVCDGLSLFLNDYSLSINPMFSDLADDPGMSLDLNDKHMYRLEQGIESFYQSLRGFFKHPFFSSVTSLSFEFLYHENYDKIAYFTDPAWAHLFAALPELSNLEVCFPEVHVGMETHLVEALAGSTNESTGGSIICSKLQIIHIGSAIFSGTKGRQALKKLVSNLVKRRKNGRRLKSLMFDGCYGIDTKDLQRMRDLDVAEMIESTMEDEWDSASSRASEESD